MTTRDYLRWFWRSLATQRAIAREHSIRPISDDDPMPPCDLTPEEGDAFDAAIAECRTDPTEQLREQLAEAEADAARNRKLRHDLALSAMLLLKRTTAERDEALARLAELGEAETEQRIVGINGTSHSATEWDLENRALWVPGVRLEERQVYATPWRDAKTADATAAAHSATDDERISACMEMEIRPAMLAGLQDTSLRGRSGIDRINEWADWIAATLAACLDPDGSQAALGTLPPQGKRQRKPTATEEIPCAFCGELTVRGVASSTKKYCSTVCGQRAYAERRGRAAGLTTRSRERGFLIIEDVDPDVVFERDRGICYLCDQPVDQNIPFQSGPEGATMDHVIPVRKGGVHSYANVKLAHRGCNSRKNNRVVDIVGCELRDQPGVPTTPTGAAQ